MKSLKSQICQFQSESKQLFSLVYSEHLSQYLVPLIDFSTIEQQIEILQSRQKHFIVYMDLLRNDILQHQVRPGLEKIQKLNREHVDIQEKVLQMRETLQVYLYKSSKFIKQEDHLEEKEHAEKLISTLDILILQAKKMTCLLEMMTEIVEIQEQKGVFCLLSFCLTLRFFV